MSVYPPPRLRAAAIIPRWSVIWTQNKDTLASHSYFVAMYALIIADLFEWEGNRAELLEYALLHDIDEIVTGDIVSPVKKGIVDNVAAQVYICEKLAKVAPSLATRLGKFTPGDGVTEIVKAADALDAVLFVVMEEAMGNTVMAARFQSAFERLEKAWGAMAAYTGWTMPLYGDSWTWAKNVITMHRHVNNYDIG